MEDDVDGTAGRNTEGNTDNNNDNKLINDHKRARQCMYIMMMLIIRNINIQTQSYKVASLLLPVFFLILVII